MAIATQNHAVIVGSGVSITELVDVMERQFFSCLFFVAKPADISVIVEKPLLDLMPIALAYNLLVCSVIVTPLGFLVMNLAILLHSAPPLFRSGL